ncbi:MAG TPA: SDR family NAD(P)-dependent oxidoreductase, partial [Abditibacterium sp.]
MATKKWVLITGAASGIGAELGRLFARDRYGVVMIDKDRDGLDKMSLEFAEKHKIETISLVYDLSLPETPPQIFADLQVQGVEIDVLVNNAGFGTFGNFWETDLTRDQALVNVNIMAPMLLTKLLLPSMVKRNRGKILNVGSVSGFLASPHASTYYASKAWLLSFSQGLATSL